MFPLDESTPDHRYEEGWDPAWDETEEETDSSLRSRRRPLMIAVAALTAIALIVVPVYNLLIDRTGDNGLEVCGFDYCIVEEAIRDAGLELEMSALYNTILGDEEAASLSRQLTDHLDVDPVGIVVVDDLDGRVGGVYDQETRSIAIERPARAWTVFHEVAHVAETGHGEGFQRVLIELTLAHSAD